MRLASRGYAPRDPSLQTDRQTDIVLLCTIDNEILKDKQKIYYFIEAISLGRVAVPSPRIDINHPRIYEKLDCKGEPYWFSGMIIIPALPMKICVLVQSINYLYKAKSHKRQKISKTVVKWLYWYTSGFTCIIERGVFKIAYNHIL